MKNSKPKKRPWFSSIVILLLALACVLEFVCIQRQNGRLRFLIERSAQFAYGGTAEYGIGHNLDGLLEDGDSEKAAYASAAYASSYALYRAWANLGDAAIIYAKQTNYKHEVPLCEETVLNIERGLRHFSDSMARLVVSSQSASEDTTLNDYLVNARTLFSEMNTIFRKYDLSTNTADAASQSYLSRQLDLYTELHPLSQRFAEELLYAP